MSRLKRDMLVVYLLSDYEEEEKTLSDQICPVFTPKNP